MKYIIDHANVSRTIEGPFNIIGSPDDLLYIAEQIIAQVGSHDVPKFSFGTVFISQRYYPAATGHVQLPWTAAVHDSPSMSISSVRPGDISVANWRDLPRPPPID